MNTVENIFRKRQKEIVALEEIYIHVPNVVSKLNTDKTYLEKDKLKSPKALPVTYIITLITTIHI